MRLSIFILAAVALLSLNACTRAQQEAAEQKAWDEMMVIHDEVMPRMSEINALSKTIETALADTTLSEELRSVAGQTLADLQAADKGMWDWMYGLQQLPDLRAGAKHEEIMSYIASETAKISGVKTAMLSSIEAGNNLAGQLPAPAPAAEMPPK